MIWSIFFFTKTAVFIFGFSILAVSMEEGELLDRTTSSFLHPLSSSLSVDRIKTPNGSIGSWDEDENPLNLSPRLSDGNRTPVSNPGEWEELIASLRTTQKEEKPHPETKKRKEHKQLEKSQKKKTTPSPDEEDLSELSQEQRDLYNQIEFEVEVGQLFKTTLPCYQWVFLMHYGKMDMPNLIEKVGHTQGTLKTYKGHLRKVGILPSTNRKKPKQAN